MKQGAARGGHCEDLKLCQAQITCGILTAMISSSLLGGVFSGCIDGFSRKMIWLNVCNTNINPSALSGYFLEAVKEQGVAQEW